MSFDSSEPGLGALDGWLATQRLNLVAWNPWAVYGMVVGTLGGIGGALTGILAGVARQVEFAIFIWLVISVVAGGWAVMIPLRAASPRRRAKSKATEAVREIWTARSFGRVRASYGEVGAAKLNEAAALALECSTLLDSPVWSPAPPSASLAKRREQIRAALDSGVLRLAEEARFGSAPATLDRTLDEIRALLHEVKRLTQRRESEVGTNPDIDPLRQTLAELREINRAEDEWQDEQAS